MASLGKDCGEDLLTQAASSDAAIKQRVNAVKTLILRYDGEGLQLYP